MSQQLPPRVPKSAPPPKGRGNSCRVNSFGGRSFSRRGKPSPKDGRTISQRFIRAPLYDMSQFVWIEDKDKVWALCTILKQDNTVLTVQDVDSANVRVIDIGFSELKLCNKGLFTDMSKMQYIHEPAILFNLSRNFVQRHQFYTYIGLNVVVSLNPMSWEYKRSAMEDYHTELGGNSETPHPFVLGERAYQGMCTSIRSFCRNQSIVVSGESGSGKTEASKLVLQYIAERVEAQRKGESSGRQTTSVSTPILHSSPILEAFGNAKTLHNPNSSRFSRYVKMLFDPSDTAGGVGIRGARHEVYLLEKARVLRQAPGEQNFHVFYQYLSGALNGSLRGQVQLGDADSFRLLNPCDSLDHMYDKFQETQKALVCIMTSEARDELWSVIGGVLQLGNMDFVDNETPEGNSSFVSGYSALQSACTLLDVDWKEMRHLMTQKVIETRDERFVVPLTLEGSVATRDAICKAIYETLFLSVVATINSALSGCERVTDEWPFIGVLDLFGFESMDSNGFDQFMINYANEAMQNCFNVRMLHAEVKLYEEENIQCGLRLDDCPSISGCLELISSGVALSNVPSSILLILDSVSQQPKGGDEKFCQNLHQSLGRNSDFAAQNEAIGEHFLYTHPKDQKHMFKIKHYAGVVTYSVQNLRGSGECDEIRSSWVESNRDAIPSALESILNSSGHTLLKKTAEAAADKGAGVSIAVNSNNLSRQKLRMKSVAMSFSKAIRDLCSLVQSTECHFIRCIKPNQDMTPGVVDNFYMIRQIRSLALVHTSEVKRVGLKGHIAFSKVLEFLSSSLLSKEEHSQLIGMHYPAVLVASWLAACGLPEESFSLGKSRVFFQRGFHSEDAAEGAPLGEVAKAEVLFPQNGDDELLSFISSLRPKREVMSKLQDILAARKQREAFCSQFQTRLKELQVKLNGVRTYLQSHQSAVPTLHPFSECFKLTDDANACLETATSRVEVASTRVQVLQGAISAATAPVNEAVIIENRIVERVKANTKLLGVLTSQVSTVNTYEQEIRDAIRKAQEKCNDAAMDHWDCLAQADKSLESVAALVDVLQEGRRDRGDFTSLNERIDTELSSLRNVLEDKLPNPEQEEEGICEELATCKQEMLDLAAEVVTRGRDVMDECSAVEQMCVEGEQELVDSKRATRSILQRIVVNEETSGDDHGMLWRKSKSESTSDEEKEEKEEEKKDSMEEKVDEVERRVLSKRGPSVSFSDEVSGGGELDDWSRSPDSSRRSSSGIASLGCRKPLTATSLQQVQHSISAVSGLSRDESLASFSNEKGCGNDDDDDDDDDDISTIEMDFWVIPNGWEEFFDNDSQNVYYLNTITQTTQWERPELPAEGTAGNVVWEDPTPREQLQEQGSLGEDDGEKSNSQTLGEGEGKDSGSRELQGRGGEGEDDKDDDNGGSLSDDSADGGGTDKVSPVRWSLLMPPQVNSVDVSTSPGPSPGHRRDISSSPVKCNLNYGRVTTTQLNALSTLPKEGYLMKQSTNFFSSRWNRKYFVLDGLRLEYYDKSEQFFYGLRRPKAMELTLSTCTSFTDDANAFTVKTTDAAGHPVSWTLSAPSHTEKNEWVTYINAHVYAHHCNQVTHMAEKTPLDRRLISATTPKKRNDGDDDDVTFWQLVPQDRGRVLPVGIRTLPDVSSSRTGEGIFPGEHVEVVSTREGEGTMSYLQLADHRGWVFSSNPSTAALLFVPAVGYTYRRQDGLEFQVADTETEGVPIQYNPGDCSPFTGARLMPGEVVRSCASFVLDMDLKHSLFVKLADGRGWANTRGARGGIGLKALS